MPAFINRKVGSDFVAVLRRKLDIPSGQYSSVFGEKNPKVFITEQIQPLSTTFTPQYFSSPFAISIGNKIKCLKYKLKSVIYTLFVCEHNHFPYMGSYRQLFASTF